MDIQTENILTQNTDHISLHIMLLPALRRFALSNTESTKPFAWAQLGLDKKGLAATH